MNNWSSKKRLLFRADGNCEIGLGHIYRCLAIADRLSKYFDCYFAIREPSETLVKTIEKQAKLILLNESDEYYIEANEIALQIVPRYNIDVITFDGYYFDNTYQKIIKNNCKAITISIDDDQPFHYSSDVVINHAGGISLDKIPRDRTTQVFLGYDYLLLRKEFINQLTKIKKEQNSFSVLVCFGGADPENYTAKVISCIKRLKSINKITVVTGSSNVHLEALKNSVNGYSHVEFKHDLDAQTFCEIMTNTSVAIVPSSTISLEAFACKMFLITGITAENQKNIYNGLIQEHTVYGVGHFDNLLFEDIAKIIKEISVQDYNIVNTKKVINNSLENLYVSL